MQTFKKNSERNFHADAPYSDGNETKSNLSLSSGAEFKALPAYSSYGAMLEQRTYSHIKTLTNSFL